MLLVRIFISFFCVMVDLFLWLRIISSRSQAVVFRTQNSLRLPFDKWNRVSSCNLQLHPLSTLHARIRTRSPTQVQPANPSAGCHFIRTFSFRPRCTWCEVSFCSKCSKSNLGEWFYDENNGFVNADQRWGSGGPQSSLRSCQWFSDS